MNAFPQWMETLGRKVTWFWRNGYKNCLTRVSTPRSCFTPVYFTPFCFNAPYQCTPLLNLRSLIFRFNALGLSAFQYANQWLIIEMFFIYGFSTYAHFFRNSDRSWKKDWVYTVKLWTGFSWPRMEKAWGRRACVNIAMNLLKWWGVFCVAERSLVLQVSFSPRLDLLCPD